MRIDTIRLRQMREQRAWSQEQLAEIAGISVRTLQRVESSGVASPETRMALASALGVAPAQLHVDVQGDGDTDNDTSRMAGTGGNASTASSTEQSLAGRYEPVPSDQRPSDQHVRHIKILLAILALLAVIAIGYQLGKDMAERERRADCRASGRTDCPP